MQHTDLYSDKMTEEIRALDNNGSRTFLSGWRIDSLLGRGSYGCVYSISKLTDTVSKPSALKVIDNRLFNGERISKEIELLQTIESPNVVNIQDFDELVDQSGKVVFTLIRMEKLNPISRENIPVNEVIKIGCDICSALEVCHGKNPAVIHRDIKPDNIMLSDNGTYKLTDFGIARIMNDQTTMTSIGTPRYMPPEVASFDNYDHRADIYSLAVTLYVFLNHGKPPFWEDGQQVAIDRRMSGQPLPYIQNVPNELIDVLRIASSRDVNSRFATAAVFKQALQNCLSVPIPRPVYNTMPAAPMHSPMPAPMPVSSPIPSPMPIQAPPMRPVPPPAYPPKPSSGGGKTAAIITLSVIGAVLLIILLIVFGGWIIRARIDSASDGYTPDTTITTSADDTVVTQPANYASPVFTQFTHSSAILNGKDEFHSKRAFDKNNNTCWQENAVGSGIGEWIMCSASSTQYVSSISIVNGYSKTENLYHQNGRVLRLKIETDTFSEICPITDEFGTTTIIDFDRPLECTFIKFTVVDAVSGDSWDDTAISEIRFS